MTPAELIALKKEAEAMNIAIANAEKQILADMLDAGTEQIKAGGGSITLQYRSSKARELSEAELELKQAIADESLEMAQANAKEIYGLQKQAYIATMKAEALLKSPWTDELKAKLVQAELARKASRQAKPVLVFDLPQPSPEELCSAEQYNAYLAKAAVCQPKRMTKLCVYNFLKANSNLIGAELDDAFEERLNEHREYWAKIAK